MAERASQKYTRNKVTLLLLVYLAPITTPAPKESSKQATDKDNQQCSSLTRAASFIRDTNEQGHASNQQHQESHYRADQHE